MKTLPVGKWLQNEHVIACTLHNFVGSAAGLKIERVCLIGNVLGEVQVWLSTIDGKIALRSFVDFDFDSMECCGCARA